MQGERGEEEEHNTNRKTLLLPVGRPRRFLAARGVLSRWYSSLPARGSASCAASRVFLAAISASMPASVARSWSRYDLSATISCTSDSRRCARNGLSAGPGPPPRRRQWRCRHPAYRLLTVSFFFARSLLVRVTIFCDGLAQRTGRPNHPMPVHRCGAVFLVTFLIYAWIDDATGLAGQMTQIKN